MLLSRVLQSKMVPRPFTHWSKSTPVEWPLPVCLLLEIALFIGFYRRHEVARIIADDITFGEVWETDGAASDKPAVKILEIEG